MIAQEGKDIRCGDYMFKIVDGDFKKNIYSDDAFLDNWPMLYILENRKQAYLGESNHAKTRMIQHASNGEKRIFGLVSNYFEINQIIK